jgi:serine protease Do
MSAVMTSSKIWIAARRFTCLILACLVMAAATAGTVAGSQARAGPARPVRELKAKFYVDFRTCDYRADTLLQTGVEEILRDEKGLLIRFPAGAGVRQNMGLGTVFSIRGDFEVTVSFAVLKADRPKAGEGVGAIMDAWFDPHGNNKVSLAHRLLPNGKAVFVMDRAQRVQGKWTHTLKSLPSTATAGKLRLEREGTLLRCRISDGKSAEFVAVAEVEIGKGDVHGISVGGSTGGAESGLDLRLMDFAVRAEVLPGLSDLGLAGDSGIKRLDAAQVAGLEEKLQRLYVKLAPSVVRIIGPKSKGGFSGVIISSDGEILTCAHHGLAPKTKVTVELADGRKVEGTILGLVKQPSDDASRNDASRYTAADVGMVHLDEKGEWPAAMLGPAVTQKGDLCLALGQPNVHHPGQSPLLRLGRILSPHPLGRLRTSCRILPGDSGGPLFDLEGHVLGVHHAMESLKTGINLHSPVEGFLRFRDRLRAAEVIEFERDLPEQRDRWKDPPGAWEPTEVLTKTLSLSHRSTVEVLGGGKVVALGLIVDEAGWVLTKRTQLTGPGGPRRLVCRLADGTELDAHVKAESREHDLTLLKVPATDLPAVRWGKSDKLRIGQLVASLGSGPRPLHYGVVGALDVKNPGIKGSLPLNGEPAPKELRGIFLTEFVPRQPLRLEIEEARGLLKAGDLITHLDDFATPSLEEFVRIRDQRVQSPNSLPGEWVKLTVQRDGTVRQVFLPLVEGPVPLPAVWTQARWNVRRNGFPNVFCHDGGIAYDRCGGPVVDRLGQVIGINIARADPMRTLAIPSDMVRKIVTELMVQARR